MLSLTGAILDQIVIKSGVFIANQTFNIIWSGSSAIYGWYYPTISETAVMKGEIKLLKDEIHRLQDKENEHLLSEIIIVDESGNETCFS
jgi:hypothetical protein